MKTNLTDVIGRKSMDKAKSVAPGERDMEIREGSEVAGAFCPGWMGRIQAGLPVLHFLAKREGMGRMPMLLEDFYSLLSLGPMRSLRLISFCLLGLLAFGILSAAEEKEALPSNVEIFTVKTRSDENKEVPFYVRRPAGFNPAEKGRAYRTLFICPVFNGDGLKVMQAHSLLPLADEKNWFVVSPTFKQKGSEVKDRKKSYYYPEAFSGKAVLEALELIAKKYPVDTNHLLLQGLSGGAQFVHRFALWVPDRVTAVAINSSSWFDQPNANVPKIAWLVTIGDSDPTFSKSFEFVSKLIDNGASPVFRSYMGMLHEGDARVTKLNTAFLTFYDEHTLSDLGRLPSLAERNRPKLSLAGKNMPFVGDSQDWKYFPNTAENRENVAEDNQIFLPNEELAKLWGKQDDE